MKRRASILWRYGLMGLWLAVGVLAARGEIRYGMSREAVIEARGRPRAAIASGASELLTYDNGVEIELQNGRVVKAIGLDLIMDEAAPPPVFVPSDVPADGAADFQIAFGAAVERFMILLAVGIGIFALMLLVAMWKFFVKAGEPGWATLIPVYNLLVILRIAGKPLWWFFLLCIPVVQLVFVDVEFCIARRFGKGVGFGLGLFLFPFIFYPILAFGSAVYNPDA